MPSPVRAASKPNSATRPACSRIVPSVCIPQVVTQIVRETQLVVQAQLVEVTATPAPASTIPEGPPEIVAFVNAYLAAWSEPDSAKRLQLLESVRYEEGTYTDPTAALVNRAELDAAIGQFLDTYPGAVLSLIGKVEAYQQHLHFAWVIDFSHGTKLPGHDYGELAATGKFTKIVGFF